MKAIPYIMPCPPQDLKIIDFRKPSPLKNEVLVKVHSFGLNFAEISARKGQYKDAPPFPFVPGYECSGEIVEIGQEVENFQIGDKVACFCDFGAYAEYARVRKEGCVKIPDGLSMEEAAAIPVQFCTAYHCLFETGVIRPTSRVLIHACAGGVGLAALQLCQLKNCITIGTCSSQQKIEFIKEKGVTHAINYVADNYELKIKEIFPDGVDVVLNSLGGETIKKDLNIIRAGGRVVCFGGAALNSEKGKVFGAFMAIPKVFSMLTLNAISLLFDCKSVCGVNMKALSEAQPELLSMELQEIMKLFEEKKLTSHVSEILPWSKIGLAQHKMETRKTVGKIVLQVQSSEPKPKEPVVPVEETVKQVETVEPAQPNRAPEEQDKSGEDGFAMRG